MMAQPEQSGGRLPLSNGESNLSSREKRRLNESQRNGPKRGATRGLKYISRKEKEKTTQEKPFANISDEMRRVVGANAGRFICECSLWVKEFCPLTARNWSRMDAVAKERLLEKIKANWNLPPLVDGKDVTVLVESQCKRLFRGWKYRLKERYYKGYTKSQAIANRPSDIPDDTWKWLVCEFWSDRKQQRISEMNSRNRVKQTIKPANGALSTARIFDHMMNLAPPQLEEAPSQDPSQDAQGSTQQTQSMEEEPLYVRLYERVKKHKDGNWDTEVEVKYQELKDLHVSEVENHGKDNLTVKEAFSKVLEEGAGYIRGLGYGPRPLKKGRTEGGTSELRARLSSEIEQLQETQNAFSRREVVLCSEIEDLKSANEHLKASNEELKASNDQLRKEIGHVKEDAIVREKRLKADAIEREKKFKEEILQMLNTKKR